MSAVTRLLRHPTMLGALLIALVLLLAGTFAIVPETRQAVILRLGVPLRVINRYHPGEAPGQSEAGLIVRIPLVDKIVWVDKRMRDFDVERQEVESADHQPLVISAYARYRVEDPLRMYQTSGSEQRLPALLRPALAAALRSEFARRPLAATVGDQRDAAMAAAQAAVNRVARDHGVAVADVRIDGAELPAGAPLEAVLEQMRTVRVRQAADIRAGGLRQARAITATAAAATAKIYADSFGQDPQFYAFYRAMKSSAGNAVMVLGPDNPYLRALERRGE